MWKQATRQLCLEEPLQWLGPSLCKEMTGQGDCALRKFTQSSYTTYGLSLLLNRFLSSRSDVFTSRQLCRNVRHVKRSWVGFFLPLTIYRRVSGNAWETQLAHWEWETDVSGSQTLDQSPGERVRTDGRAHSWSFSFGESGSFLV